jgi:hypothetical protein
MRSDRTSWSYLLIDVLLKINQSLANINPAKPALAVTTIVLRIMKICKQILDCTMKAAGWTSTKKLDQSLSLWRAADIFLAISFPGFYFKAR